MSKTAAEPLVRISKREGATFVQKVLVRAIAILLALVVDAFFIFFVTGLNPISVYGVMWNGTFMNTTRFSWALRDLSSLLCIAIALAPAFKMRFWNIGGEGQVLIGGLVAALIMVYFGSSLPAPLLFAAMVIGSVLAGAIWAFVPAWFKSRWNTNETLFTLMMNYVATSIVACMTNIMRGQASSLGTLNKATKAGWLPVINGQRYTINIIVVLVLTFAMYAYLKYSKQGYEISVVGESENTARYAGINVSRVMIRTMLLSGAICGLCGFLVVAGKDQTISTTSAGGNGFTATRLTDAEGNADDVTLTTPACALSLDENNTTQPPYAVCDLVASKPGYRTVRILGVQVFPGQVTLAQPEMIPDTEEMRDPLNTPIVIPPHSLFTGDGGSGPTPALACVPRVLDRVIIPKNITVHLGRPAASARNVTVSFRSYIANVASSEVYPTWADENSPAEQSNCLPTQKFHSIVIFCSPVSGSFGLTMTRWTNSTTSSRVRYETCASSRTRCLCVWTTPVSSCCCSSSVSNVSIRVSAFFTSSRKVWFISEN